MTEMIVRYVGFDPNKDKKIISVVGKRKHSSGCCLLSNERDLQFSFKSQDKAKKIANILRKKCEFIGEIEILDNDEN